MNFFAWRFGKQGAAACDESLAEHDKKYHPNGFDPEHETCNKRAELAKSDKGDMLSPSEGDDKGSDKPLVSAAEDAAYMDAVNRGDMETAAKMVREVAGRAFPNTKVVGDDGLIREVFHGTPNAKFTSFKPNQKEGGATYFSTEEGVANSYGGRKMAMPEIGSPYEIAKRALESDSELDLILATSMNYGSVAMIKKAHDETPFGRRSSKEGYTLFWKGYDGEENRWDPVFSKEGILKELKDGVKWSISQNNDDRIRPDDLAGVYHCFINMTNPLIIDAGGAEDAAVPFEGKTVPISKINRAARRRGHDGVIVRNVQEYGAGKTDDICVFSSAQIKSGNPVAYDDFGNVIPLSRRFDGGDDIRGDVSGK